MHGEAKGEHGLRRAVRRGLTNVSIQAYLTAAVINLKRLACSIGQFLSDYLPGIGRRAPIRGLIPRGLGGRLKIFGYSAHLY